MKKIIILLLLICPFALNGKSSYCNLSSIVIAYVDSCNQVLFENSTMQFKYEFNPFPPKEYGEELPPIKKVVLAIDYLSKCKKLRKDIIVKTVEDCVAFHENKCAFNCFSDLYVLSDDRILLCVCTHHHRYYHLYRYMLLLKDKHKWKIQKVKEFEAIS